MEGCYHATEIFSIRVTLHCWSLSPCRHPSYLTSAYLNSFIWLAPPWGVSSDSISQICKTVHCERWLLLIKMSVFGTSISIMYRKVKFFNILPYHIFFQPKDGALSQQQKETTNVSAVREKKNIESLLLRPTPTHSPSSLAFSTSFFV